MEELWRAGCRLSKVVEVCVKCSLSRVKSFQGRSPTHRHLFGLPIITTYKIYFDTLMFNPFCSVVREIFDKVEVETKKRMKTAGRLFFSSKRSAGRHPQALRMLPYACLAIHSHAALVSGTIYTFPPYPGYRTGERLATFHHGMVGIMITHHTGNLQSTTRQLLLRLANCTLMSRKKQ